MYNKQGIVGNYPQAGVGFWGDAENNYGFGISNIAENIENHPMMHTTPVPLMSGQVTNPQSIMPEPPSMFDNSVTQQSNPSDLGQSLHPQSWRLSQQLEQQNNIPQLQMPQQEQSYANALAYNQKSESESFLDPAYDFAADLFNKMLPYIPTYPIGHGIGIVNSDLDDKNGYINSVKNIIELNNQYNPMRVNDKYKHAMINCLMAQKGTKAEKISQILSGLKENYDVLMNKNTSMASDQDMEANIYGRAVGRNNIYENCEELVGKKYKP